MYMVDFSCRAPVLVALALIELGLKYEDAVDLIRKYVVSSFVYSVYSLLLEHLFTRVWSRVFAGSGAEPSTRAN